MVYALVVHAAQAGDDAPLVPGDHKAFPRGPQLGGQLVVIGLGRLGIVIGGLARLGRVGAQLLPLGAQLGVFVLGIVLGPPCVQEPVAGGSAEFFSTASGSSSVAWASMWPRTRAASKPSQSSHSCSFMAGV